ncbi:MAG: response regulator [Lachnospiraceae bacterium]|nr:response regulator [Lachnospiraceae bacterium]
MFHVLVGLQIFAIVILSVAMIYMFRGNSTYTQKLMLSFTIAELVHNAGFLLELLAKTQQEAMLAIRVQYLGGSFVAILFMMFISNYCNQKEQKLFERILLVCACLVVTMVWTSPYHTLYYSEIEFIHEGVFPHLKLTYGIGFYFYFIACTVIPWASAVCTLVKAILKEKNKKRRGKLRSIINGAAFALGVLVLYLFKLFPEGYDPTPVAMALMFTVLVIFVWNRKDFDLSRTATETVLNSLGDCMIALDESNEVVMYNDAAKKLFVTLENYRNIKEVNDFPLQILEGQENKAFELNGRHYEVRLHTLEDFEQAVRGYTVVITDVTETYERIRELNEMREKAEEANLAKSNFLANMSHEIRTPMNAIVGMSELIIEECHGRKVYDYACDVKNASKNLLSIINDILDLSKVEAGKMVLVEQEYFVQAMIRENISIVKVPAEQKGLDIEVDLDENIPHLLYGDMGRIGQILINIMNNSIKFTKQGGVCLKVTSRYLDEEHIELQFVISDTGIGIKEEELDLIFESFRQLDMNKNRKTEGTGLGLAITKQLVALMEGDISVESEYGKGTSFTVKIKQKVIDRRTIKERTSHLKMPELEKSKQFGFEDCHVLVVDDNAINRKVVDAMLSTYNLQPDDSDSGKDAIEKVKQKDYDIIFMDHMMPEMDGIEATKIIREECDKKGRQPIIIALTANALRGAREMYLENGFDDFLSKPFERKQLSKLLERWIPKEKRVEVESDK